MSKQSDKHDHIENTRNNQSRLSEISEKLSKICRQNSGRGQSNLINITQDTELCNFLNQDDPTQGGSQDKKFSPQKKYSYTSPFNFKIKDMLIDEESLDNFYLNTKPEIQQIITSVKQKQLIETQPKNPSKFYQLQKKEILKFIKNDVKLNNQSSSDEDLIQQDTERIVLPIRVQTHNTHMQELLQYSQKRNNSKQNQLREEQNSKKLQSKVRSPQQSLEIDFKMFLLQKQKESLRSSVYSINQIEQLSKNICTPESKRSKDWPNMECSPRIIDKKNHSGQQPGLKIQLRDIEKLPDSLNEISTEQENQLLLYMKNSKKITSPIQILQKEKKSPDFGKKVLSAKAQNMQQNQQEQQTSQTQSFHPSKIIHESIEQKSQVNDSNLKEDIQNSQNLMISDTSSKLESQDIAILYEQLSDQMRSIDMQKINQKSFKNKISMTGKAANVLQKLEARRSRVQEYFIKRDELQVPKTDLRKKTKTRTKNSCSNSKTSTQTKKNNTLYQTQKGLDLETKQKDTEKTLKKGTQIPNESQFDQLFQENQVLYQKTTTNNSEKDLDKVIETEKKIYVVESPKIIKQIEMPYSQIPNSAQILQLMESTTGKKPESGGLSLRIGKSATVERKVLSNDEKQDTEFGQPKEFLTIFIQEQQNEENQFFDNIKIDSAFNKQSKSSSKFLDSYKLTSTPLLSDEKQENQIQTLKSDQNSMGSDNFQPQVINISEPQLKFEKLLLLQKIEQNDVNIDQLSYKTPILSLNNTPGQKNLLTDKKLSLTSGPEQTLLILTPELNSAPSQKRKSGRLTFSGQYSATSKIDLTSKAFPGALNFTLLNDYRMGRMLGQGAYALVREAIHIQTGFTVAIKIYDKNKLSQNVPIMKSVQREIKMLTYLSKTSMNGENLIQYGSPENLGFHRKMSLKSIEAQQNIGLGHPSLMKLYDAIDQKRQLFIILESCKGEELHKVVKKYSEGMGGSRKNLSEEICAKIMHQLLEGMKFYHKENICHRDLKLENILVDIETANCQTKIIDFGFATQTDSCDDTLNNFCGTPAYMAPEMVLKQEYSGPAIDIWAAGVVFYTILFGTQPFKAKTEADLFSKISKGKLSFPKSSHQDFAKNKILRSAQRNDNDLIAIRLNHIQMTDGSTGGPTEQFLEPELLKNLSKKSQRNSGIMMSNRQNSSKALMKLIEKHKGGDSGLHGSIGGQFTDMMSESICYSRMAKELVQEMLTVDQKQRPTAADLLVKYRQWFQIHSAIF